MARWRESAQAARALRAQASEIQTIRDAIRVSQRFVYRSIRIAPIQLDDEIEQLLLKVKDLNPRVVLEIGTARGGTLFLLTHVAAGDAVLISVDLPSGKFGGGYDHARSHLYKSFARNRQQIKLIQADSHASETLGTVKALLGGRPIDFLFIDGDHSYEGVRTDFEMYSPLVRSGGIIAMHDIVPGSESLVGGVPRYWEELKARRPVQEFVCDWKQGKCGIGIVSNGGQIR